MADTLPPAKVQDFQSLIEKWNAAHPLVVTAAAAAPAPIPTGSSNNVAPKASPTPKRTLCRPVFDDDNCPVNPKRVLDPDQVPLATFEAETVSLFCT